MVNDSSLNASNAEFCSDILGVELGERHSSEEKVTVIEIPAVPEPEPFESTVTIKSVLKRLMAPVEEVRENWKYLSPKRSQAKRRKHARQGR